MLIAASCAGHALAAEYGLGISAKSDSGLLFLPIEISAKLRVEPFMRHQSFEAKQTVDFGSGTSTFRTDTDQIEGGVGVFGLAVPKESVRFYYGGRASYFDGDTDSAVAGQDRRLVTASHRVIAGGELLERQQLVECILRARRKGDGQLVE